jgi:hypothetical protein
MISGKFSDQAKQQRLDEAASIDENGYATFEMRQSRRGTMSGTMKSTRSLAAAQATAATTGTLGNDVFTVVI